MMSATKLRTAALVAAFLLSTHCSEAQIMSGGKTTLADGADTAQGTTTDTVWVSGAGTIISLLKAAVGAMVGPIPPQTSGAAVPLGGVKLCDQSSTANPLTPCATVTAGNAVKIDGSAVTQPVSGADPCFGAAKTNVTISTASGTTALVTGVSAKKIYVCSFVIVAPSAVSVSLSEGSGTTCGTSNQAGVIGVATNGTAANGMPFAANGGLALGNGNGTVASTATNADYLCLFQSGTAQLAGNLTYVQL
jgi:hypothetical protein